jgi:hypothetical protein
MYPSGLWRGYWEQAIFGRQPMNDFALRFADGVVEGEGRDIVGRFTFRGSYDDRGNVVMVKQYLGAHRVLYRGCYDGEGTISGVWSVGDFWTGPFALSPVRSRPARDAPIQDIF